MVEMLPSPVRSDDGYRMVAPVLALLGFDDDDGGGGGNLQWPDVSRKGKWVAHIKSP